MTSKNIPSIFEEALVEQHQQESHHRFTLELGLFIVFLFGSFMAGINNLGYNTLFLDEAIYAVAGEDFLQGIYSRNAPAFLFGSYLYPALSAVINNMGGVTGLRLASTLFMCLTSVFVYFTTRKLFGQKASLFSMMLFAFSGVILNLGQLAVYDALALPFLAASLFLLVTAVTSEHHQKYLLLASSVCAILATLSKYIGLIYLPALCMTALALFWLRGNPVRQALSTLFFYFVLPILQALSLYVAFYWRELIQVFQGQGFSLAPRWLILKTIGQEMGFIMLPALVGFVLLATAVVYNRNRDLPPLFWNERPQLNWNTLSRSHRILFFTLAFLLLCTWLAAPLYHWGTANIRSLWKNCAYSLIFLSPLAGYCAATFVKSIRFRSHNLAINILGMLCLCTGIVYFADKALDSNWSFHQSWPNTAGAITYLRDAGLNEDSRVLAEGMDVYEYYFDFGTNDRPVWNSFWYMEYAGVSGQEGALAAIRGRALDFIIIEDYYFPGIRERISPLLAESGYVLGWQEQQELRTGEKILLQIFILSDGGAQ